MDLKLETINQINVINYDMKIIEDALDNFSVNTLKFKRDNITIRYKKVHIVWFNNIDSILLTGKEPKEYLTEIQSRVNDICRLTITGLDDTIRVFERYHIDSLGGVSFIATGIATEFYKSTLYDMLYPKGLIVLANRNPALEESINLLEVIDTKPSDVLSDDEVCDIYDWLSKDIDLITVHLEIIKHARIIATRYPMNLKSIEVNNRGYVIKVYNNVKELRFEECVNVSLIKNYDSCRL